MPPNSSPGSDPALDAVREQFRSAPNAEDRYRAMQALVGQVNADEAVSLVRSGLDDADSMIRAGAARWLGSQAGSAARPGSEDDWTRIAARWMELLSDPDPDVRFESARGLIRLDPACEPAADALWELLRASDAQPTMLAAILDLLARIPLSQERPVPPWLPLLQHDQAQVREASARASRSLSRRSPELARALATLLDDDDPFVREEAAKSLGSIGVEEPSIIAALESASSDEDELVASAARASLQQLTP